jgi:hypothetical protein
MLSASVGAVDRCQSGTSAPEAVAVDCTSMGAWVRVSVDDMIVAEKLLNYESTAVFSKRFK